MCSTVECNQCAQYSLRYENANILQLQVTESVSKSLELLMAEEPLTGLAVFNCPVCGVVAEGVKTLHFAELHRKYYLCS